MLLWADKPALRWRLSAGAAVAGPVRRLLMLLWADRPALRWRLSAGAAVAEPVRRLVMLLRADKRATAVHGLRGSRHGVSRPLKAALACSDTQE